MDLGELDLCHIDEAGFAMTLATSSTWFFKGERLRVPKGFVKVRSFGLFRSGNRPLLAKVREVLAATGGRLRGRLDYGGDSGDRSSAGTAPVPIQNP